MTAEMASLITRQGGEPLVAPALREVPRAPRAEVLAFGERLLAGEVDVVVLLTGVGTRQLVRALEERRDRVVEALGRTVLVARGPKPVRALAELGLTPTHVVAEPNTWRELLRLLDERVPVEGRRVAVQEYGMPNEALYDGLAERGAVVTRVPVYQWALPEDTAPLADAVGALVDGRADVVLFTNAAQVSHLMQIAERDGRGRALRRALGRVAVFSVGPTTSEMLREFGLPVDGEPEHPKMGHLVRAAAERAREVLAAKRALVVEPAPVLADAAAARTRLEQSLFLRACRREPVPTTPVWLMRQAGRYMKEYRALREQVDFLALCRRPDLAAEVTVNAVERLGVDAAILFSDLLVVAEPLGFPVRYTRGEGPVIERPIRRPADVDRVLDADPAESLAYVFEAVRRSRAALPADVPLVGFAAAPFTLASYLIEGEGSRSHLHTKTLMYRDPGAWAALMERLVATLVPYVNGQIAAGAQAVQLFDSWVGVCSPADYRAFVLPHTRRLIAGITPGTPVIHFGTQTASLLEAMREAGGDVIGLDWRIGLDAAWARLGDVAVQGNLDPAVLLAPPDVIRAQAARVLAEAAGRPGHVFNLGHGILPPTPLDHVRVLVDAVHELSAGTRSSRPSGS
jgi:uroporphyrinogen decarboxylase